MKVVFTVSVTWSNIEITLPLPVLAYSGSRKGKNVTKHIKTLKSHLNQCNYSVVDPFLTRSESVDHSTDQQIPAKLKDVLFVKIFGQIEDLRRYMRMIPLK